MKPFGQPHKVKDISTPDAPGRVLSLFSVPDSSHVIDSRADRVGEEEAATYLRVTTRTLRNYRRTGKLAYREVPGKTRPTVEYRRSDLDKMKQRLDERRTRSTKPREQSNATGRVTFSIPATEFDQLKRDAGRCGLSVPDYARRAIRDRLESQYKLKAEELKAELEQYMIELRHVRADFAAGFEVVLEFVGVPPDEAKKWVKENLR